MTNKLMVTVAPKLILNLQLFIKRFQIISILQRKVVSRELRHINALLAFSLNANHQKPKKATNDNEQTYGAY
jgi:hypothetical protein